VRGVRAPDDRRALGCTAALARDVRADLCQKARRQGGARKRATGEWVAGRGASPVTTRKTWRCRAVGTRTRAGVACQPGEINHYRANRERLTKQNAPGPNPGPPTGRDWQSMGGIDVITKEQLVTMLESHEEELKASVLKEIEHSILRDIELTLRQEIGAVVKKFMTEEIAGEVRAVLVENKPVLLAAVVEAANAIGELTSQALVEQVKESLKSGSYHRQGILKALLGL